MDTTTLRRVAQRTGLVLAVAATTLAASTVPANAGTSARITFSTGPGGFDILTYSAGAYDPNVRVSRSGNLVIFKDMSGGRILNGTPEHCYDNALAGRVQCNAAGIDQIVLLGSSGPDVFQNASGIASRQVGLGGADILVGAAGVFDAFEAGPGDDTVYSWDGGYDHADCGAGTDRWTRNSSDGGGTGCETVDTV